MKHLNGHMYFVDNELDDWEFTLLTMDWVVGNTQPYVSPSSKGQGLYTLKSWLADTCLSPTFIGDTCTCSYVHLSSRFHPFTRMWYKS